MQADIQQQILVINNNLICFIAQTDNSFCPYRKRQILKKFIHIFSSQNIEPFLKEVGFIGKAGYDADLIVSDWTICVCSNNNK